MSTSTPSVTQQGPSADAFRDFEKAAHGRLANSYDEAFTAVAEHAIEPLLRCARVREGTRLLDVASGPGELTARAAQRGADVIGVDIAPEMVALARKKHPG
jgi:cyclopropane fatty-acyl-phospholipid synthase-like methyltransferase